MTNLDTPIRLYMVGGAVRDHLDAMHPSRAKDLDFAVEALDYGHMRSWLTSHGARLWMERPQFASIRCSIPAMAFPDDFDSIIDDTAEHNVNADFTLCRRDGFYSDSRHPDEVFPGTIEDDLARRDFTMNAIAMRPDGSIIDPHMGQYDLRHRIVRAVGSPSERFEEDPLRILRALRFSVTKGMVLDTSLAAAVRGKAHTLPVVSVERAAEELTRMFTHNTLEAMYRLTSFPEVTNTLFNHNSKLWLTPTLRNRD